MKKHLIFIFLLACSCTGKFSANSVMQNVEAGSTPQSSTVAPERFQLSWKANLGEQQGFNIERSTDGVNFTPFLQVADGMNSVKIEGVAGQKYYFRIRGFNQAGDSSYSAIVLGSL